MASAAATTPSSPKLTKLSLRTQTSRGLSTSKVFFYLFMTAGWLLYLHGLWKSHVWVRSDAEKPWSSHPHLPEPRKREKHHPNMLEVIQNHPLLTKQSMKGSRFGHVNERLALTPDPRDGRPPLATVVQNNTIVGDVSQLLHYAVVGFGKCGTTTIMDWLVGASGGQLRSYPKEIYDLMQDEPALLVTKLYHLQPGVVRPPRLGYKSPTDMSLHHTMAYFRRYFYRTRLIVGIRHPVLWFQSMYNFRVQNAKPKTLSDFPSANDMIGRCTAFRRNTCTYKGEFALFLRNTGFSLNHTATLSSDNKHTGSHAPTLFEQALYKARKDRKKPDIQQAIPNHVFLFDVDQFADAESLGRDLSKFLNLTQPLSGEMPHRSPGRIDEWNREVQKTKDEMKIDICADEYIPLRFELMRLARVNSAWIRHYFLPSSQVWYTASLEEILEKKWMVDPCVETEGVSASATAKAGQDLLKVFDQELKSEVS